MLLVFQHLACGVMVRLAFDTWEGRRPRRPLPFEAGRKIPRGGPRPLYGVGRRGRRPPRLNFVPFESVSSPGSSGRGGCVL